MLGFLPQLNIYLILYLPIYYFHSKWSNWMSHDRSTKEQSQLLFFIIIIVIKGEPFAGSRNVTVVDLREGICGVRIIQLNEQHLKSMSSLTRLIEKAETRQLLPLTQSETESICSVSNCLSNISWGKRFDSIWPCCKNFPREHGTDATRGEKK